MNMRIWQVWFGNVNYGAISGGWFYHYGRPSGRRRRRTTLMIMAVRVSIMVVSCRSWMVLQLLLVVSDLQWITSRRTWRRRWPVMVVSVHIHWIVWWIENMMMNYICMLNSNGTCRRRRRRRRSSMIHICV